MSKHTPGPWIWDIHGEEVVVANERLEPVASLPEQWDNQEANARLIAAAPELLTELQECVEYIKAHGGPRSLVGLAEKAIAKAKGQS